MVLKKTFLKKTSIARETPPLHGKCHQNFSYFFKDFPYLQFVNGHILPTEQSYAPPIVNNQSSKCHPSDVQVTPKCVKCVPCSSQLLLKCFSIDFQVARMPIYYVVIDDWFDLKSTATGSVIGWDGQKNSWQSQNQKYDEVAFSRVFKLPTTSLVEIVML